MRDGRIGENKTKHGRHVWFNHPRSLGKAGNRNRGAVDFRGCRGALWEGIGRHDGLGSIKPTGIIGKQVAHGIGDAVGRGWFANYTG